MTRLFRIVVLVVASAFAIGACSDSGTNAGPDIAVTTTTSTVVKPAASTVAALMTLGRPVILAHAAGEDAHPHSTPYGYADSVAAGVDILDFDVQLSKDGVLVVQHDDSVDRTTNGTGKVADMTYAELNQLDNAYWFTDTCTCKDQPESAYRLRGMRTGAKAPLPGYTADDFIIPKFADIAAKYPDFVLNIEIKGSYPDSVPAAKELARILKAGHREDQAVVTAFDDQLAEAFHAELPSVAITPGLSAMTSYVLQNIKPPADRKILQVPPDYEGVQVLTPGFIERAKADGMVLWIWPNERKWENADGYTQLLDMGVEGINASDPKVAVDTLRSWKQK